MAEVSKSISYEVPNKVTGKTEVVIYSTTGEPRTQKEFDAAKQAYKAGEEASMKDFAFLPPGSFKEVVRRGFEAVNQPVQKGLRAVGGAVGEDLAPTGFAALAQKLGIVGPGAEQRVAQAGRSAGQTAGEIIGSTVSTPENALATAGTAGALAATGGLSLPLQTARMGSTLLGNLVGRRAGTALAGGTEDFSRAVTDSLVSTATQGALGAFLSGTRYGLSNQAQERVASKLVDITKGELKGVMSDPKALERFASTRAGMDKMLHEGLNALRGDMEDTISVVMSAVSTRAPHSLDRSSAHNLRKLGEEFYKTSSEMLDNIANKTSKNASLAKLNALKDDMKSVIDTAWKKEPTATQAAMKNDLEVGLQTLHEYTKKFEGTAELFGAMRRASGPNGFNAGEFQKELSQYFVANPAAAMTQAAEVMRRGAPVSAGIDRSLKASVPIPHTPLRIGIPGVSGQRYVGRVQSPMQPLVEAVAGQAAAQPMAEGLTGNAALKSFYGQKE